MIIPRFTLSQDSKTLTINILARYCKLSELEVEVIEECFFFSCWPYYLRLTLPGRIVDNESTRTSFDSDTGEFTFRYNKVIEGEIFEDLDFITKFLVKKVDASYGFESDDQKISVLSCVGDTEEDTTSIDGSTSGFGFALQGGTQFQALRTEYFDVFEVDPFKVSLQGRRKLRLKNESLKFDVNHYLCDFIEDEEIMHIIEQVAPWQGIDAATLSFTHQELDFLKNLPNKIYKLNSTQENIVFNTLIDILYAYCYNQRITYYEQNSESGWNIVTLSASLSWLDIFETPRETVIFAFRRSLVYPLFRNFKLSIKVLEDLKKILHLGEKFIIKCLIDIYYIFLSGDCCRYILNNLFITDYINYVMRWDKTKWQEFLQNVGSVDIKKTDLGLHLIELEEQMLEDKIANLKIQDNDSDDSLESEDDDSDSSENESGSSVDDKCSPLDKKSLESTINGETSSGIREELYDSNSASSNNDFYLSEVEENDYHYSESSKKYLDAYKNMEANTEKIMV